MHPSQLMVTSPPDLSGLPSRPHFTASSEACKLDVTTPTTLLSSLVASWRRALTYPLARHLLQGWMIGEIVWSQEPNKVLWAVPQPVDPAEQLLPQSYRCALCQIRSTYCSWLMSFRHYVGWANDPTCSDCHATDHTVALISPHMDPGDMWTAQVPQFLAGFTQFSDLSTLQVDFDSFPLNLHSCRCPPSLATLAGPLHILSLPPFSPISSVIRGIDSTPPLPNNNQAS